MVNEDWRWRWRMVDGEIKELCSHSVLVFEANYVIEGK